MFGFGFRVSLSLLTLVRKVEEELWSGWSKPSRSPFAAVTCSMYFWSGLTAAEKMMVAKSLTFNVNSSGLPDQGMRSLAFKLVTSCVPVGFDIDQLYCSLEWREIHRRKILKEL